MVLVQNRPRACIIASLSSCLIKEAKRTSPCLPLASTKTVPLDDAGLQTFIKCTHDDLLLLLPIEFDEMYCIARHSDSQVGILFGIFHGIF